MSTSSVFEITVTDGELSITNLTITFVNNANVTTSENWSLLLIACDSKLGKIQCKLLFHCDWEYERTEILVSCPMLFWWIPIESSISTNYLTKLSFQKEKSVWSIVTFSVEGFCAEIIFAGPKNNIELLDFSIWWKKRSNKIEILCNFTVNSFSYRYKFRVWNGVDDSETISWPFVDIFNFVETICDIGCDCLKYFSIKDEFTIDPFFVLDKKLRNDIIQLTSGYFIEIFIVYLLNKSHHCLTISEGSDENLKLKMFFLDFFDQIAEKCFHLLNKLSKIWCACIGILVNDVFQFCPGHFLASFVEKTTLISVTDTLFTNEAGLLAVGIYTKNCTFVSINTLRMFLDLTWHCTPHKI